MDTLTNNVDPGVCGISSRSALFVKIKASKLSSETDLQFILKIVACDPLKYVMDHSDIQERVKMSFKKTVLI